jgi:hypothetical protein
LAKIGQKHPVIPDYPFALPTVCSAILFIPGLLAISRLVKDPLYSGKLNIELSSNTRYRPLNQDEDQDETPNSETTTPQNKTWVSALSNPFIWVNSLVGLHIMAFDQLLPIFIERPVSQPTSWIQFSTGLGKGTFFNHNYFRLITKNRFTVYWNTTHNRWDWRYNYCRAWIPCSCQTVR